MTRRNANPLINEIFAAINDTFQWRHVRNQRTQPLTLKSITRKFGRTSRLSSIVTITLGLGVPLAYGMGFFVISSYLINTGSPLPLVDFSTNLWLISLAALIIFAAIMLTGTFFYALAFVFPTSLRLLKYTRITTLNARLSVRNFVIQWSTVNGVALAILLFITLAYFTKLPATPFVISAFVVWLCATALAIFLISRHSMLFRRCALRRRLSLCTRVVGVSWWKMFWAAWLALLLFQMSKVLSLPILIAFIIYLYVTYFVSSTFTDAIRYRALGATIFVAFVLIMLSSSYSGRKALQVLHIGGGIPVSILRKTMVSGGKDIVAQTIEACMVLNSGSHIIIKVIDHPTLDTCQAKLSPTVNNGERELPKGIETIAGSDVISVTML